MRSTVQSQLASILPPKLVDELLEGHAEAKRNFHLGGLRLSEVEGGRFCEAAFRILEFATTTDVYTNRAVAGLRKTYRSAREITCYNVCRCFTNTYPSRIAAGL